VRDRASRRAFLKTLGLAAAACAVSGGPGALGLLAADRPASRAGLLTKAIPATGERVPVLGMGSWITFDVPDLLGLREPRVEVLRRFFGAGGAMIDSSPMYGRSEATIGHCLRRLSGDGGLFAATKVWTPSQWHGRRQIEESEELWGVRRFDLLQIHNMLSWEAHLETLLAMKEEGRVRYVGITTSHGRRHEAMERVIAEQPFDFVQLTYNLRDREAEARLLPLAAEHGRAVIVNRPFRRGALIDDLEGAASAAVGRRDRLRDLAPVPPEVRRLPSGRHVRHPGHLGPRPHGREHARRLRAPARLPHARAHGPVRRGPLRAAAYSSTRKYWTVVTTRTFFCSGVKASRSSMEK
jgi:diketogulonate reductase-like aldo/keto reductase